MLAYAPDTYAEPIVPLEMFEALIAVIAVPLPEKLLAFTTLAEKDPLVSRSTIVEAPLAEEAVVLALSIVPEAMLDALIPVTVAALPLRDTALTRLASKLPLESRRTIVEAPLAEAAVVRALSMVPDEMLLALIALIPDPSPLNKEALMTLEPKLPEASRRTIVLALLAVFPVVRAFEIVPLVMFEALMSVKATALPVILVKLPLVALTVVKVPTLALKEPLVSLRTIVDAPLDELAVV
jgi:hypothetical protein